MEAYVLDTEFRVKGVFEKFESLIWTDRYTEYGDFQLHIPDTRNYRKLLDENLYLKIPTSDRTMVIETEETSKGITKTTGRSLESLLQRRVVEDTGPEYSSLIDTVKGLVSENITSFASNPDRAITNLDVSNYVPPNFTDPKTYDSVGIGDNLYDVVKSLCESANLGFKIINASPSVEMDFELYYGFTGVINRLVFSESMGNIQESRRLKSDVDLKNTAVVNLPPPNGEDGIGEIEHAYSNGSPSGLNRREIWVDASSLRQDDSFTVNNKLRRMRTAGRKELSKHRRINDFDFKVPSDVNHQYMADYNLGDLVSVLDKSGEKFTHRVIEYIQSYGKTGNSSYPTLALAED